MSGVARQLDVRPDCPCLAHRVHLALMASLKAASSPLLTSFWPPYMNTASRHKAGYEHVHEVCLQDAIQKSACTCIQTYWMEIPSVRAVSSQKSKVCSLNILEELDIVFALKKISAFVQIFLRLLHKPPPLSLRCCPFLLFLCVLNEL